MTTVDQRWAVGPRRGAVGGALLVVPLLVAANAVYGGVGLVLDGLGMPPEWLERLPVDTWTWPGVALLGTVALPQLVAAWFVWRHDPRAGVVALAAGVALVLWIVVQVLLLQRYFFLQPVITGLVPLYANRRAAKRAPPAGAALDQSCPRIARGATRGDSVTPSDRIARPSQHPGRGDPVRHTRKRAAPQLRWSAGIFGARQADLVERAVCVLFSGSARGD